MKWTVQKTPDDLAHAVDIWLEHAVNKNTEGLFLPAGNTLRPVYKHWRQFPPQHFKRLRLLQMDEVLEGPKKGCFQDFFSRELPSFSVEAPAKQPFTGSAIAILGLGLNGHIAFHEPGLPKDFSFGEVLLRESSANELGVAPDTPARTYGLGTFLRCSAILLVVTGTKKKTVFSQLQKKDPSLPATHLLNHPQLTIFCDEAVL